MWLLFSSTPQSKSLCTISVRLAPSKYPMNANQPHAFGELDLLVEEANHHFIFIPYTIHTIFFCHFCRYVMVCLLVSLDKSIAMWEAHATILEISLLDLLYFIWLLTSCPAAIADMSDSSPARTEPATMVASSLEFAPGDSLLAPFTPSKLRHADWDASCVPPPTVPTWEPQGKGFEFIPKEINAFLPLSKEIKTKSKHKTIDSEKAKTDLT